MLRYSRNLVFRVSIVINIAVLFYAAMHLSGPQAPGVEWIPGTAEASGASSGSERAAVDERELVAELRNDTQHSAGGSLDEPTSQKTPSTTAAVKKTASSTAAITEYDKRLTNVIPSEADLTDETLDIVDENALSDATLARLQTLLACNKKDYITRRIQRGDYWVLKNYVQADHGSVLCHETLTYSTHAGFEFLDNVLPLVERWMAPVSLAIHAPGADILPAVKSIRYLRDCLGNDLVRQYVTFHLFFSHKHIPKTIPNPQNFLNTPYNCSLGAAYENVNSSTTYMKRKSLLYPVNVARNVARDAALTHFILPSDIELYPSPYLVPRFLNMIARNDKPLNTSTHPRVFPISIFEVAENVAVPTTKTELQGMLANKTAIPFHKYVCPLCHSIPQSLQWMTAAETNQMDVFHVGKRQGKYVHWEPIFIGTNKEPYYDERLSWDGKQDKMTQGYVLCVRDYDFMILNNAFLTHKPGIKHYKKNAKRDAIAWRQTTFVKKIIMPELKKLFGTRNGCAL